MTALLPNKLEDFGSHDYWEGFFKSLNSPFEWYGDFATLVEVLLHNIRKPDSILEVGCGNSQLSASVCDKIGCCSYLGIDYSLRAIEQSRKLSSSRPNLRFEVADVFHLSSDLERIGVSRKTFNVIIDKGTLDAIDNGRTDNAKIDQYFEQISTALDLFGRYIVITLAQEHVVRNLASFFLKTGSSWIVSCMQVTAPQERDAGGDRTSMPLFAFVCTKMKPSSALPQLRLKALDKEQPCASIRGDLGIRLVDWIKYLQTSCMLGQSQIYPKRSDNSREFDILHESTGTSLFRCRVLLLEGAKAIASEAERPKAVLLVPQDDAETYASAEGSHRAFESMGNPSSAVLAFANPLLRFVTLESAKSMLSDGLCSSPLAAAVRNVPIYSTPDSYPTMRVVRERHPYAVITEALKKRKALKRRMLTLCLETDTVYKLLSDDNFSEPSSSSLLLLSWITFTRCLITSLGQDASEAKMFFYGVPPCFHTLITHGLQFDVKDEPLKCLLKDLSLNVGGVAEGCCFVCYDATVASSIKSIPEFLQSAEVQLISQGIACILLRSGSEGTYLEKDVQANYGTSLQVLCKQSFDGASVFVLYKKKQKLSRTKFAIRLSKIATEILDKKVEALESLKSQGCSDDVLRKVKDCICVAKQKLDSLK